MSTSSAANPDGAARTPQLRELAKILADCRDLAIHRLLLSFSAMLDRIADMLMERSSKSDVREDSTHFLAARSALLAERATVMAEFERLLREQVNARIAGEAEAKADFSKVDAANLTLIDTSAMDEAVITGNITRVIENFCHEELLVLNRSMAHLLGRPELETKGNPLSPSAVIDAFAGALRGVDVEDRIKFTILKELNQSSLGDLSAIYGDINRHLVNLRVVPTASRPSLVNLDYETNRARVRAKAAAKAAARNSSAEVDVMALFRKMFGEQSQAFAPGGGGMAGAMRGAATPPGTADYHGMSAMSGGPAYYGAPGGSGGAAGGAGAYGGRGPYGPGGTPSGGTYAPGGMYGGGGTPAGGSAPGARTGAGPDAAGGDAHNPLWMLGVQPEITAPRAAGYAVPPVSGTTPAPGSPGVGGGPDPFGLPSGTLDPFPRFDPAAGPRYVPRGRLAATPSGYVPGAPIMVTRELGESLSRLQSGETGFDLGGGAYVQFAGIPEDKRNVLRDLQDSPLAMRVNQLEGMTIELVALLFDFIFETRDLPDGIKALLARLQIPVLKAAMLDGAFFAKKSHPARTLVNALSHAGMGWSPAMGYEDPLYRKIHDIVHKIIDEFVDNLAIFEDLRNELERFLAEEEKAAEHNIQTKAEEIRQRDRKEIAPVVASSEIERQIGGREIPNFLASFLRGRWAASLEQVYLESGEDSEPWLDSNATIEDLVWSVQPKRSADERKQLVKMLPSLLKRLSDAFDPNEWPSEERELFLENLVEAHTAAVKPAPNMKLPTAAVAVAAKAEAEQAKAAGDNAAAAKAEQLAEAMAPAEPVAPVAPAPSAVDDPYLEIAQSLERGMWVEFEDEDGQLAFSKLAWVSPLRGTYLFCNRQGQKATSMTAEELAQRFREDKARLVEAEPLVDRAFTSMMQGLNQKLGAPVS